MIGPVVEVLAAFRSLGARRRFWLCFSPGAAGPTGPAQAIGLVLGTLWYVISLVERARATAEDHLAVPLPGRWIHVQAVGAKAMRMGPILLDQAGAEVLTAAAWLHDIGYAPDLIQTGFHPLDGARWLRSAGFDGRVVSLVANHSCAHLEAAERGLAEELAAEFPREEGVVPDALWYCDMTTGPDGQDFEVTVRLGEIRARYGPGDVVTRFIIRAEPEIVAAVRRTEERLNVAAQPM